MIMQRKGDKEEIGIGLRVNKTHQGRRKGFQRWVYWMVIATRVGAGAVWSGVGIHS
jgi:hypothetical protein